MPAEEQDMQQQDSGLTVKSALDLGRGVAVATAATNSGSSAFGLSKSCNDNDSDKPLQAGSVARDAEEAPNVRHMVLAPINSVALYAERQGEARLACADSASASIDAGIVSAGDKAEAAPAMKGKEDGEQHEERRARDEKTLDALTMATTMPMTVTRTMPRATTEQEQDQEKEQEREQKAMVTRTREAEGYAHACQAVFAGYIAVAHRQNLEPTIQGFWATPQRGMILPSLSILADLVLDPGPAPAPARAPAFQSVDTADHLHTRKHVQIQVPLEQVADVPHAREKAALHAVLERKDNRYTSACRPPPPPSSTTASTDTDTVLQKSAHTTDQQVAQRAHSAAAGDSGSSSNGQAGVLAIRFSSDRTPTQGVRYRLTSLGRDLFRPMARVNVSGDTRVGTSANGKAQMPTPLAGISPIAAAPGLAAPMMSPRGGLAVESTPAWWDM